MKGRMKEALERFKKAVTASTSHTYLETRTEVRGGHTHVTKIKKTGSAAKKEVDKMVADTEQMFKDFVR